MTTTAATPSLQDDFYTAVARYSAKYRGETVVIKFGGELVAKEDALRRIAVQAINLKNLGCNVVLIHGGGRQIDERLQEAGVVAEKVDGVRVTSEPALKITAGCLSELNTTISRIICEESLKMGSNVRPWGLGGHDGAVITAKPKIDGMFTGEVTAVDIDKFAALSKMNVIPVVHPICAGEDVPMLNVNADDVAAAIAQALGAKRLVLCSDTYVRDKENQRIKRISDSNINTLIEDGTLTGGMLAKIRACSRVVDSGRVEGVVILDGKDPTSVERELLSDEGAGTLITKAALAPSLGNKATAVFKI